MRYILILALLCFSGCTMNRQVLLDVKKGKIRTIYGIVEGEFTLNKITRFNLFNKKAGDM